ncbi:carboxyl-terminal processing protease [Thermonema lapsum]|uniref:Carboxyl-terminal processing protease n=1 Tax=Thermonema lapsum TaxID=28195 RepID=A0A846MRC7_9BACT|nr:S41 family peptidase [Thermonema lapsum]NIK74136.1 carboxyl-terminal processing protease [Thermonema lapsum]
MNFMHSCMRASLLGLVLWYAFFPATAQQKDNAFEIAKNLDIFATLFKEVNTYYVDEVNVNRLMQKAIDAMLSDLDPYTNYISEDRIEDYRTMTTGRYAGIGATIRTQEGKCVIVLPYSGSPAQKAGLKIGDQIVAINGVPTEGKNSDEVSTLLKGQSGTSVELEILRPVTGERKTISITREEIRVSNVPYFGMLNKQVGYIQLSDFTMGASEEVRAAMDSLKKAGARAFILDLRNNPGGLLSEAINVVNLFIPKSELVVSTKGKISEWNKEYFTLNAPYDLESPLAILVNNRSASASEIVAGALQDYDRAILIGQRTFGKGLVQVTRPLSYNAQLKITIAKYYIPSGRCIQAIDYSVHNADGSLYRIPDSLRRSFKTRAGRVVFDGAGLEPDIVIPVDTLPEICNYLLQNYYIFNYGVDYAARHTLGQEIKLTSAVLEEFIAWLEKRKFRYTTSHEEYVSILENQLKEAPEIYASVASDLKSLKSKLQTDYRQLIAKHKDCVLELIEDELYKHVYFEKAEALASFDTDREVQKALELLTDTEKYAFILGRSD